MSCNLKSISIKKTRKDHECNACVWLTNAFGNKSKYIFNEVDFTDEEKQSILKAESNNWMIKKGEPCTYFVSIYDGEFGYAYQIDAIHDICVKYDIYDD